MTLDEFIQTYDFKDSMILLEGKRNILPEDREKLFNLGKILASRTAKMIFRSGNANRADQLFSDGVAAVDNERLQVITPYSGHTMNIFKQNDIPYINQQVWFKWIDYQLSMNFN